MLRLQDKITVVTGGATGIGEAIVKRFAKEGARVFLIGMPQDPVEEVRQEVIAAGGVCEAFSGRHLPGG